MTAQQNCSCSSELKVKLEAAEQAIQRIINMHSKIETYQGEFCKYCSFTIEDYWESKWPCGTIQELNYETAALLHE